MKTSAFFAVAACEFFSLVFELQGEKGALCAGNYGYPMVYFSTSDPGSIFGLENEKLIAWTSCDRMHSRPPMEVNGVYHGNDFLSGRDAAMTQFVAQKGLTEIGNYSLNFEFDGKYLVLKGMPTYWVPVIDLGGIGRIAMLPSTHATQSDNGSELNNLDNAFMREYAGWNVSLVKESYLGPILPPMPDPMTVPNNGGKITKNDLLMELMINNNPELFFKLAAYIKFIINNYLAAAESARSYMAFIIAATHHTYQLRMKLLEHGISLLFERLKSASTLHDEQTWINALVDKYRIGIMILSSEERTADDEYRKLGLDTISVDEKVLDNDPKTIFVEAYVLWNAQGSHQIYQKRLRSAQRTGLHVDEARKSLLEAEVAVQARQMIFAQYGDTGSAILANIKDYLLRASRKRRAEDIDGASTGIQSRRKRIESESTDKLMQSCPPYKASVMQTTKNLAPFNILSVPEESEQETSLLDETKDIDDFFPVKLEKPQRSNDEIDKFDMSQEQFETPQSSIDEVEFFNLSPEELSALQSTIIEADGLFDPD